ncbi:homocysteine S-methyltransferase [Anabrus simplex]|uniref:homocysteine S-methyltransferase n=1 Tax=Anabrus simplex TaxID=316456 RepID=UPI0035A2CC77
MSRITVLDGGFATQLSTHVDQPVDGTPLWSASFLASHPQACIQTHLDFLNAGSEAICTNTYQAYVGGFMKYLGLSEQQSIDLIRSAVDLARQACNQFMTENPGVEKPLVVGSIGPYAGALNDGSEYTGSYIETVSKQDLIKWHRPRFQTLVEAGVDLLALETIPALEEAEALIELLKEFPSQKAWLSFSCKDELHTSHGETFQDAVRSCWVQTTSQLVAVGANCLNPKFVSPLMNGINTNNSDIIPLVVYPNSGEIYDVKLGWLEGQECRPVEEYVHEWLDLGVRYIGGCCRTYPKHIMKIKAEVNKWKKK